MPQEPDPRSIEAGVDTDVCIDEGCYLVATRRKLVHSQMRIAATVAVRPLLAALLVAAMTSALMK
jgi:hypothetical protein